MKRKEQNAKKPNKTIKTLKRKGFRLIEQATRRHKLKSNYFYVEMIKDIEKY